MRLLLVLAALLGYGRSSLVIEALCAVAEGRVAHEPLAVADTVVLLAIVPLAVAALADIFLQKSLLFLPSLYSRRPVVIEAVLALAHPRYAPDSLLQTHAVELAALTSLAVATLYL